MSPSVRIPNIKLKPARSIRQIFEDKMKALAAINVHGGDPITGVLTCPDGRGRFQHFAGGLSIYYTPETGAHAVWGYIRGKWEALGSERSFLGYPLTDETGTPDGIGRFNHFEGGSIYWTPQTGPWEVHGAIRHKWAQLGWETSFLGYPVTDETATPDGRGRFNHFQGGSIYWTPQTWAHEVHGAIRDKWALLGWERFFGYPTTDETVTPDGIGRFNHFEGGSIYWTPQTGAHAIYGAIRHRWAEMGWETSFLGYPTSDELQAPDNWARVSHFQGGSIYWTPQEGPQAIAKGGLFTLILAEFVTAHETTETWPNTDDELYFLSSASCKWVNGSQTYPARKIAPQGEEDYYLMPSGRTIGGIGLIYVPMPPQSSCLFSVAVRDQDNGALPGLFAAAQGAAAAVAGAYFQIPPLVEFGKQRLKQGAEMFVSSLGKDNHDTMGSIAIEVRKPDQEVLYEFEGSAGAELQSSSGPQAVFKLRGAGGDYTFHVRVFAMPA
jgi:uncharacterized protein with LGFP repeats